MARIKTTGHAAKSRKKPYFGMDTRLKKSYIQFMSKDWKKTIKDLIREVGPSEARRLLVIAKVSPHTADKMIADTYPSEVRASTWLKIREALESARRQSA